MSITNATSGEEAGSQSRALSSTHEDLESVFASLSCLFDGAEPPRASAPAPAIPAPQATMAAGPTPVEAPADARPVRKVPRPTPRPVAALTPSLPVAKARPIALPALKRRPERTVPPPHCAPVPWAHPQVAATPAVGTRSAPLDATMTLSTAVVAPPPASRRGHLLIGLMIAASVCLVAFLPGSSTPLAAQPLPCAPSAPAPAAAAAIQPAAATACTVEPAPPAPTVLAVTAPRPLPRTLAARPRKTVLAPTPAASPQAPPPPPRASGRLFGSDN